MSIQAKPDAVNLGVAVKQMISEIDWREHYRIKAIKATYMKCGHDYIPEIEIKLERKCCCGGFSQPCLGTRGYK